MPSRPNTPCRHPGCPALVPYGQKYCDKHKLLHPEEVRSASARGYGRAWQKARQRYLAAHPLCVECMKEGKYVKATDVDHIIPHRGDKRLFWDEGNWQALCHSHHSIKTRNEDENPEYRF
ncbi:MAG: HNH endonuclease [Oscillospiraceae bacterium]|nr:HNH endonuclease [Oscillospiraceae bacterium]